MKYRALVLAVFLSGSLSGRAQDEPPPMVVPVVAHKFEYRPSEIVVKKGVPVVLELRSEDKHHGFNLPAFGVRADVEPKAATRVRFTPDKAGRFPFHCDVFCGLGHEDMTGVLIVEE